MTVIICDKIRADAGNLVSEELRKRAAQCIQRSTCNQAVVWISRGRVVKGVGHLDHV